jgi:hypothetical protein
MFNKLISATAATFSLFLLQTLPAAACGSLLAPNGAIRLERATTLVAWHDGIERYMTSFTYQGDVSNLGWIVPLPTVPEKIEEGGGWTLQRLVRETHPQPFALFRSAQKAGSAADSAEVIMRTRVQALDITVVKGSGQAVLDWADQSGFTIDDDTHAHLLQYAKGSPIFMAAKYDTKAAQARKQLRGDGAPVLITMKMAHPWVPFEVLALDDQQVQADLYLLTDNPVNTSELGAVMGISAVGTEVPGAPGFKLAFQEPMNDRLYRDLSSDKNMSWVRPDGWLTYMTLDAPFNKVTYDMSITPMGVVKIAAFGTKPMAIVDGPGLKHPAPNLPTAPLGTGILLGLLLLVAGTVWVIRYSSRRNPGQLSDSNPDRR